MKEKLTYLAKRLSFFSIAIAIYLYAMFVMHGLAELPKLPRTSISFTYVGASK